MGNEFSCFEYHKNNLQEEYQPRPLKPPMAYSKPSDLQLSFCYNFQYTDIKYTF